MINKVHGDIHLGITPTYIDRNPIASMTNNPPWERFYACLPLVFSCKQQIISSSIQHDVSNIHDHEDTNTAVLSLVATTRPRP